MNVESINRSVIITFTDNTTREINSSQSFSFIKKYLSGSKDVKDIKNRF